MYLLTNYEKKPSVLYIGRGQGFQKKVVKNQLI